MLCDQMIIWDTRGAGWDPDQEKDEWMNLWLIIVVDF